MRRYVVPLLLPLVAAAEPARDGWMPPWIEPGDVPISSAVKSVRVKVRESALYQKPGAMDQRRGTLLRGGYAPLFAAQRGPHCAGRWLLVGPSAWLCADEIEYTSVPFAPPSPPPAMESGLPFEYFFVHGDSASAYASFEGAGDAAPEGDLDRGFFLPLVEVREKRDGTRWGRTRGGQWISMSELAPARPLSALGKKIEGGVLDVAWVRGAKGALVRAQSEAAGSLPASVKLGRAQKTLPRFTEARVQSASKSTVEIELPDAAGGAITVTARAADLSIPTLAAPPAEVRGADERWIDIELASQTLVAYEGKTPIFATLVSTGKGAKGSSLATPPGVFRVWVKLFTSNMDNLEQELADDYYSIADVPYVQFFHKGVALHAAFWHRDFGHVHSHGCVNLTPEDARFLYHWTAPHMPAGWDAVLPSVHEKGTVIRVR